MKFIKRSQATAESRSATVREHVLNALRDIEERREAAIVEMAKKFDGWEGNFILSDEKKERLIAEVPLRVRDDLKFAHEQVSKFALAQRASLQEFSLKTLPGVTLGQRVIPMNGAGCYVPGGRFAHACSAIMSVATAKAAGVPFVVASSPPHDGKINPAVAYAMDLAGADVILEMGGIQAIASMALGFFTGRPVDILVGPGNAYVAEAKALLAGSGRCCIDVFAGPTESAVIADRSADPMTIAIDLVSQAEHGYDSPVWLFTDSHEVANQVLLLMDKLIDDMPNPEVPRSAWRDYGEIILCQSREELCAVSDKYAPEHVQVMASDLEWWLQNLRNYGSLFLGEFCTVPHGDKCSGTNHILPTKKAGYYSGGLNVLKFLKVCTYQELTAEANLSVGAAASRLSRVEGMEGHARSCDWRLTKLFPDAVWDFHVYRHPKY